MFRVLAHSPFGEWKLYLFPNFTIAYLMARAFMRMGFDSAAISKPK